MAVYPNREEPLARPTQRKSSMNHPRKLRMRALAFFFIAAAAALGSAWLITGYLARRAGSATAATSRIVVAAADIAVATTLRADMFTLKAWPQSALPTGTFTDLTALEGRVAAATIVAGEPVVEARLTPKGAGAGMAAIIPANSRAMTVRVNDVIGVAGFIHPGDRVDVLTTMQAPKSKQSSGELEYRSKIVLQNIKVLAVGEDLRTQNSKPVKVPVVTLLVSPEESERLALASSHGELQLTMRSQSDDGQVPTPGISPPELLGSTSEPALAKASSQHRSKAPEIAKAVAKPEAEVVEILRGDRFEERKMRAKETP